MTAFDWLKQPLNPLLPVRQKPCSCCKDTAGGCIMPSGADVNDLSRRCVYAPECTCWGGTLRQCEDCFKVENDLL